MWGKFEGFETELFQSKFFLHNPKYSNFQTKLESDRNLSKFHTKHRILNFNGNHEPTLTNTISFGKDLKKKFSNHF